MFEDRRVASHQRWCCETKHLPVGEVPGHNREYNAQRTKCDVALCGIGGDVCISQKVLRMFGKVITVPRTLPPFSLGFRDRFSHFKHSSTSQRRFAFAQMASNIL